MEHRNEEKLVGKLLATQPRTLLSVVDKSSAPEMHNQITGITFP